MLRCGDCGRLRSKTKEHQCPDVAWNKGITGYTTSKRGKKYPGVYKRGFKMTPERMATQNMSGLKLGQGWNRGVKGAESHMFGATHMLGKKMPNEVKSKIAAALVGHTGYMSGKSHSTETRRQMSETHRRRVAMGLSHWGDGTKTLLRAKIRGLSQYRQWRESIFKRDDYICQMCGVRGGGLHADHIKPFALILFKNAIASVEHALACDELWDTSNGRTLCIPCHKTTDSYLNKHYIMKYISSVQPTASPPTGDAEALSAIAQPTNV